VQIRYELKPNDNLMIYNIKPKHLGFDLTSRLDFS